ncbi:Os01g0172600, partial [Oryza sativa Japonica Group]
ARNTSWCSHHRADGLHLFPVPALQLHGDGERGPDDQPVGAAAAAGAVPARRRRLPARGAGPGQPGGVRRELLQERQGRRRRAGVRPAAVGRRRDAGRRAELRRQRQGALRPPVQLRVPQGHGQDEQHRRQDRQPGRDQEEVLQVQLGAVAQSTVNFVIDRVTCPE